MGMFDVAGGFLVDTNLRIQPGIFLSLLMSRFFCNLVVD
ncbi:hypothetical protein DSUL_60212 [Desulfovibrionales bacterium]